MSIFKVVEMADYIGSSSHSNNTCRTGLAELELLTREEEVKWSYGNVTVELGGQHLISFF